MANVISFWGAMNTLAARLPALTTFPSSGVTMLLRCEGAAVLTVAVAAYASLGASWWLFTAVFLLPDLSMAGYLKGPRLGARVYNAAHTYTAPLLLGLAGAAVSRPLLLALGAVWVAHIGLDRMLGYGLKLPCGFADTHLGRIGRTGN